MKNHYPHFSEKELRPRDITGLVQSHALNKVNNQVGANTQVCCLSAQHPCRLHYPAFQRGPGREQSFLSLLYVLAVAKNVCSSCLL